MRAKRTNWLRNGCWAWYGKSCSLLSVRYCWFGEQERASKYNKSIKVKQRQDVHDLENMTDVPKIAAIAVVLVNDRFLTSHAYLKDSAVCVRACHLAATGKDPRGPVFSALRQAKLGAEDVQLVEVQGTVSSPSQGQVLLSNGDFKEDAISAPELAPLVGFGTTSLTGLCEIGK
jgi:hypothetical protein